MGRRLLLSWFVFKKIGVVCTLHSLTFAEPWTTQHLRAAVPVIGVGRLGECPCPGGCWTQSNSLAAPARTPTPAAGNAQGRNQTPGGFYTICSCQVTPVQKRNIVKGRCRGKTGKKWWNKIKRKVCTAWHSIMSVWHRLISLSTRHTYTHHPSLRPQCLHVTHICRGDSPKRQTGYLGLIFFL